MAVTADRVVVELQAKLDQYRRELAAGDRDFDRHMKNMRTQAGLTERATVKSFGVIGAAGGAMAASLRSSALALAGVAGATAGIRVLADFAQAMSTVRAVTGATETQFDALEKKARQLGATTRFSATQAAEGMLYLARAGFDTDQVLGSIEGTLRLAQAGNLDLGRAADIASNVLQGFRLEVTETARVVDVLALAANSSNTDVGQLGEAMKYAAPIAAGLKVGVEDTAAAVSALSDAGIQASMAGTGLRRVMIGLETQSKQGQKVLAKYGLTMEDISMRSTGSLANSLQRLADAGITTADAMTLFGLRGGPAFEVLQSSIPKVRELTAEYEAAGGTAERIAEVMDKNLNGALLQTKSRLQELILAMGEAGAEDSLIAALEGLSALLTLAAENADILSVAIVALTIRAILPFAASLGANLLGRIAALRASLVLTTAIAGQSTTALTILTGAVGRLWFALGPLTIAIAAASAAYVTLARSAAESNQAIRDAEASIESTKRFLEQVRDIDAFIALRDGADLANPVLETTQSWLQRILNDLREINRIPLVKDAADVQKRIRENEARQARLRHELANPGQESAGLRPSGMSFPSETNRTREAERLLAQLQRDREALEQEAEKYQSVIPELWDKIAEGGSGAAKEYLGGVSDEVSGAGALQAEIKALEDLNKQLARARESGAEHSIKRLEEQVEVAETTIDLLKNTKLTPDEARAEARDLVRERRSGGTDEDKKAAERRRKDARAVLDELDKALMSSFDVERDAAQATYEARLAAMKELGLKGKELNDQQAAAAIALQKDLAEIDRQEKAAQDDKLKREKALVDQEEALLNQALDARDRAADRSIAIALRDFERRREILEKSFADTPEGRARRDEALGALDEEKDTFLSKARSSSTGFSTLDDISERIKQVEAARDRELALELEKFETLADYEEEFQQRRIEIVEAAEAQITEIKRAALAAQLGSSADTFETLADLAKTYAGKQSGVYKTLFTTAKAFKLAETLLNAPKAYSEAVANSPLPFPLNIAAGAASSAAVLAQAAVLRGVSPGFRRGVVDLRGPGTSTSDSIDARLSRGESVITAEATRRNERLLRLMNDGVDVEGQLARINQPLNVNQSIIGGGARNVSVAGSSLIFNGPVDEGSIPALRALIEQRDREIEDRIRQVIARDRTRSTPRHERGRFFRD